MVTADKLPSINAKLPPHEKLIRVFNPAGKKVREEFHTRKLFDKVLRKQGWIELGGDEDISEVLMKNRPKTSAEIVLEEENRKLREELAIKNGAIAPASEPPTFSLSNPPDTPIEFNLERNAAEIAADLETIDRVAVLNEILAAEKGGQDRAGVKQSIVKRITDLS